MVLLRGQNSWLIFLVGLTIVTLSFLDNTIGSSFMISYEIRTSVTLIVFVSLIFVATIACQIFLMYSMIKASRANAWLKRKSFTLSHCLLIATISINAFLFTYMLGEMIASSAYSFSLFVFFIVFNYSAAIFLAGILVFKFMTWSGRNKNLTVLLYGTSIAFFFLASTGALVTVIQGWGGIGSSVSSIYNPYDNTAARSTLFLEIYRTSSQCMLGIVWIASALMLKNYSLNYTKGIGKKRFWVLVSLPLIYFVVSIDFVLSQLYTIGFQYPSMFSVVVYSLSAIKYASTVFFGIAFIVMAKYSNNKDLKVFLSVAGTGIMILFSSLQISVLQLVPYPPFGLATVSNLPVAAYLLLIGLSYSALSLAYDRQILVNLRNRIKSEPFLSGIGTAEWTKNVERTVEDIMKRHEVEMKVIDSDLSTEDIQRYILEVLKETKKGEVQG